MRVNLLPEELKPSRTLQLLFLLGFLAFALIVVPAGYYYYYVSAQVIDLKEQSASLQVKYDGYASITALVNERDGLLEKLAAAEKTIGARQSFDVVSVFDEFTSCVPDTVVVSELNITPQSLFMVGLSKDHRGAGILLNALAASDLFGSKPVLSYLYSSTTGYNFAITVEVVGGVKR